jgi:hypothetical protein
MTKKDADIVEGKNEEITWKADQIKSNQLYYLLALSLIINLFYDLKLGKNLSFR